MGVSLLHFLQRHSMHHHTLNQLLPLHLIQLLRQCPKLQSKFFHKPASQASESLPDLLLLPHLLKKRLKPEISMYFIARIGLLYVEPFVQNAKSFLLTLASVVAIPCLPRPVSGFPLASIYDV